MRLREWSIIAALVVAAVSESPAAKQAKVYVEAVRELNEKHARSPGKENEAVLAKQLPVSATKALETLLETKSAEGLVEALHAASDAALDLDRADDFAKIRARLVEETPQDAAKLDTLLSRPRFVLRGTDGVDAKFLSHFADVLDGVLVAYDEVFGFREWSKVPGKKLRVRVHLVDQIVAPPHFAPEFPFHSEIDFPVADTTRLESPTADKKFLLYGLCHELGHVIAMWGAPRNEADHHAWACYTGVAVLEHLAKMKDPPAWLADLQDAKWRSLTLERAAAKDVEPSTGSRAGVLSLLIALHDRVGPQAIGSAINKLDAEDKRLRVNRVRYYDFSSFERALLEVVSDREKRREIEELLR
ncbi:MAG TPA: hypothetical protein VM509_03420 [Planctomycetota bacterium]|nr:hypothetical protein [Planctomycetota bacterium]